MPVQAGIQVLVKWPGIFAAHRVSRHSREGGNDGKQDYIINDFLGVLGALGVLGG
jgi:hypothetical protein